MGNMMYAILLLVCMSSMFARTIRGEGEQDDTEIGLKFLDQLRVLTSAKKQPNNCGQGWHVNGAYCYKLVKEPKTWGESQSDCKNEDRQRRSDLVYIKTPDEQNFIANLLKNQYLAYDVWTDAYKTPSNTWIWEHDSMEFTYTAWAPGQPQEGYRMVLGHGDGFKWRSTDGYARLYYMCKKNKYQ